MAQWVYPCVETVPSRGTTSGSHAHQLCLPRVTQIPAHAIAGKSLEQLSRVTCTGHPGRLRLAGLRGTTDDTKHDRGGL